MIFPISKELKYLKQWVKEGEGLHLEFKLKSNHPDKIMREIVAFANTDGGKLILGVSDDLQLVGLKHPDEDIYVMERAFARYSEPSVNYQREEVILENGKIVLIYHIQKSEDEIIYFIPDDKSLENKVYVRNADKSIQASREVREILKQQLKAKNYRFQYGDKEKFLMKYLDENESITVSDFSILANIPLKIASKTLILLVLSNVLKVTPHDTMDKYSLKTPSESK